MIDLYLVSSGNDGPTSGVVYDWELASSVANLIEFDATTKTVSWVTEYLNNDDNWESVDGHDQFRLVWNLEDGWISVQKILCNGPLLSPLTPRR